MANIDVARTGAKGELIDDEGNVTRGRKTLAELFGKFFEKFPKAKLTLHIDSIRTVGPDTAIEEGTRFIVVPKREAIRN